MILRAIPVLALMAAAAARPAGADVSLHPLFSDGAVLQRGTDVPVWGTAADGEAVTVRIQGKTASANTAGGRWRVVLSDLRAGGPFELTVSGANTIRIRDVHVGEVWVCAGQSNMALPLAACEEPQAAIAASANPQLRFFNVPMTGAREPLDTVPGSWQECGPATVSAFSGVAYYFGRDLQKALGVPVGLIHASVGGTPAETWMSRKTLESGAPAPAPPAGEAADGPLPLDAPSAYYNGMIAPLMPFAIRGVVWYQGESNCVRAYEYRFVFEALIRNWREDWKRGDFPFLFVQLASWDPGPQCGTVVAELRDSQLAVARKVRNTAMAVITDAGDAQDIHPKKKEPVGARLALAARAVAYGERIVYSGPLYKSMTMEKNGIRLAFDPLGGGLVARGGALTGFTAAGPDGAFVPATAEIRGDGVVVTAPGLSNPVAVRYGWANFPDGNLFNQEGLPASPFRTDDFRLPTQPTGQ